MPDAVANRLLYLLFRPSRFFAQMEKDELLPPFLVWIFIFAWAAKSDSIFLERWETYAYRDTIAALDIFIFNYHFQALSRQIKI